LSEDNLPQTIGVPATLPNFCLTIFISNIIGIDLKNAKDFKRPPLYQPNIKQLNDFFYLFEKKSQMIP